MMNVFFFYFQSPTTSQAGGSLVWVESPEPIGGVRLPIQVGVCLPMGPRPKKRRKHMHPAFGHPGGEEAKEVNFPLPSGPTR